MNMPRSFVLALLLVAAPVAMGQSTHSTAPEIAVIPTGNLRLKAFLSKHAGPGPFPIVPFNNGSGGAASAHTVGLKPNDSGQES